MNEVYVARQPILDHAGQTYAYELLYRSGGATVDADILDGSKATAQVIATSLTVIGLDVLSAGKLAFINFTREMLVSDVPWGLPPEQVVIEILEDVPPEPAVLEACIALRKRGYRLALDDFCFEPARLPLLDVVDIVKVDFLATDPGERARWGEANPRRHQLYIAEKVEDAAACAEARALGYEYLQGYFFCRPTTFSGAALSVTKLARLRLLQLLHRPDTSLEELYDAVRADVSLAYGLLRIVNSAALGVRQRVEGLWRAMLFLGLAGTRRWLSLVVLADLGSDMPPELIVISTTRARCCELVGQARGLTDRSDELFLLGLLSLLDVLLGQPFDAVLAKLPITGALRAALLGQHGTYRSILNLVLAYERADWPSVVRSAALLGIEPGLLTTAYCAALDYSQQVRPSLVA